MADPELLHSHEERLQRYEALAATFMAHAQTEEVKWDSFERQMDEIKTLIEEGNKALHERLDVLARVVEEHEKSVTILLTDRATSERRIGTLRKFGVTAFLAILGGLATQWGEMLVKWFKDK